MTKSKFGAELAAYSISAGANPAQFSPAILIEIIEFGFDRSGAVRAYIEALSAREAIDAADGAGLASLE